MLVERFRKWYEHEKAANQAMLNMLGSVPVERRTDPAFAKAVDLAAHLALCRENWLNRMDSDGSEVDHWFETEADFESLPQRFANIERFWTLYLHRLSDDDLARSFEFAGTDGAEYSLEVEVQLTQMVGHAFYHRGQVAMLVDSLGGETVDTDYLFWAVNRN
jgi:uncharacterized damage-inducible protein DinB